MGGWLFFLKENVGGGWVIDERGLFFSGGAGVNELQFFQINHFFLET